MNESIGKVMTQTKIEVCKRVKCDMNNDDRAREVAESTMSAKAAIYGTNDELTRMNSVDRVRYEREVSESSTSAEGATYENIVDIAKHESGVNDKAKRVVSQESEGQKEQGQTEQAVGSLGAEVLPESLVR